MSIPHRVATALKQAAEAFGPGEYVIAEQVIVCPHCGHQTFELSEAQLNQALSTFGKLDWLDASAAVLRCTHCSRLQWFGERPTRR